jgi:DMSO/TMAO reductase YedYZ molybdopterin-dependent catalytic subunit
MQKTGPLDSPDSNMSAKAGGRSSLSRRQMLLRTFAGGLWISVFDKLRFPELLPARSQLDASLLGIVPFTEEGHPPMGEPIGSELDGRLFTDLTTLTPENPLTPAARFFIRTRVSKLLSASMAWSVELGGAVERPVTVSANALAGQAVRMGTHLMECSGNTRAARFGMLSVAAWEGVPLQQILKSAKPKRRGASVLVSGFDRYQEESMTSTPGAAWIFRPDELLSSHAFLATKMNGQLLAPDHGAPVRLMVPGWYGCACIKWVNQIQFVSGDAPATSQMQEYADRTGQRGAPSLARDYQPALAELAAMPTRIEKWRVGGKIRYRVLGIQWGGRAPTGGLEIRFTPNEGFVPVGNFHPSDGALWSFWSQSWTPPRAGEFTIRLRLNGSSRDARRLNSGYYERSVDIAEV